MTSGEADPELLALLTDLVPAAEPPPKPVGAIPIKRVTYTHAAMIDLIIANPWMSQDDLARHFGYSATWISNIIHSDAFQTAMALRKDEVVDPVLRQTVEDQFKGLVARSLEIIRFHLNKPARDVPVTVAMKALEVSAKAAGFGAKVDQPPAASVHIHLETMADNLTGLLRKKKAEVALEGDFVEKV